MDQIRSINSDWSRLSYHLLDLVLENIVSSIDYLQFSAVCTSWYYITKNQNIHIKLRHQQVPMLIIHAEEDHMWRFYNVMNSKFLDLNLYVPYNKCFSGSSEGWLVTVNEDHGITLYRPTFTAEEGKISRNRIIHLPPLFPPDPIKDIDIKYRGVYVKKAATFTNDPIGNPDDFAMVVIYGEFFQLASIRPAKDNKWTCVVDIRIPFDDVVYYNNQFYAVTNFGKVISFDVIDSDNLNIKLVTGDIPTNDDEKDFLGCRYLVESNEELLMVERYWDTFDNDEFDGDRLTIKFKVFKLSLDGPKWLEIKNLGDVALFLGDNSSLSIMTSNFDECRGNCIYFTHDEDTAGYDSCGPCDIGVYNIESRDIKWRYNMELDAIANMFEQPPIWLVPEINPY